MSGDPIRVGVLGAAGRMGRMVAGAVTAAEGMVLAAAADPLAPGSEVSGVTLVADVGDLLNAGVDVVDELDGSGPDEELVVSTPVSDEVESSPDEETADESESAVEPVLVSMPVPVPVRLASPPPSVAQPGKQQQAQSPSAANGLFFMGV